EKGIISRSKMQKNRSKNMLEENILKLFYQSGERLNEFGRGLSIDDILSARPMKQMVLEQTLKRLRKEALLIPKGDVWCLTDKGIAKSSRIVKLHRLWELYLTKFADMSPQHVHENAELIEHIITPELELE